MKLILLIMTLTVLSPTLFAQQKYSARTLKRKATECTANVIPWMYRKSLSKRKNLVVFSKSFDEKFLELQNKRARKNRFLRGEARSEGEKRFMVELTNLLLGEQRPFMRDCVKLHLLAEKRCKKDLISGDFQNSACFKQWVNATNLSALRERHRL